MSLRYRSTHSRKMAHNVNMLSPIRPDLRVDVAGTGFTVLDRLYADGNLTDESLGGSCGNVLVSLAMLRRQVAPVLALGADVEGERLLCEFVQAGAQVHYIRLHSDLRSPVLAQELHTASGIHGFSFVCPETSVDFPRYQPISEAEVTFAMPMLSQCSVFYADRLSDSIVEAMRAAWEAGATIFFEPSDVDREDLFDEAIGMATILKYSVDRLGERLADVHRYGVRIVTHGPLAWRSRMPTETSGVKRWPRPSSWTPAAPATWSASASSTG
jgi:fructokinase